MVCVTLLICAFTASCSAVAYTFVATASAPFYSNQSSFSPVGVPGPGDSIRVTGGSCLPLIVDVTTAVLSTFIIATGVRGSCDGQVVVLLGATLRADLLVMEPSSKLAVEGGSILGQRFAMQGPHTFLSGGGALNMSVSLTMSNGSLIVPGRIQDLGCVICWRWIGLFSAFGDFLFNAPLVRVIDSSILFKSPLTNYPDLPGRATSGIKSDQIFCSDVLDMVRVQFAILENETDIFKTSTTTTLQKRSAAVTPTIFFRSLIPGGSFGTLPNSSLTKEFLRFSNQNCEDRCISFDPCPACASPLANTATCTELYSSSLSILSSGCDQQLTTQIPEMIPSSSVTSASSGSLVLIVAISVPLVVLAAAGIAIGIVMFHRYQSAKYKKTANAKIRANALHEL
jgi:hypothetical protein